MIDEVDISRNINTQGCSRKGSQFYSQSFNVGDSRFHEEVEVGEKKNKGSHKSVQSKTVDSPGPMLSHCKINK